MRYRSVHTRRDRSLEVAMTPMIDVVFMLLIFFVWTASFQVAELILPSSIVTDEGQGHYGDESRVRRSRAYRHSHGMEWATAFLARQ